MLVASAMDAENGTVQRTNYFLKGKMDMRQKLLSSASAVQKSSSENSGGGDQVNPNKKLRDIPLTIYGKRFYYAGNAGR